MLESANYAVVFVSQRSDADPDGYARMADRMVELARSQPGFVDVQSVRDEGGKGITVSYWTSLDAIRNWSRHAEHLVAQRLGRERWYRGFRLEVTKIERQTVFGEWPPHGEQSGDLAAERRERS